MSAVSPYDARVLVSPTGYARLCSQLELLRSDGRRRVADRVAEARRDGALTDNPALAEALEEQAQIELRIAELERRVETARIVEQEFDGSAQLGCRVCLRDLGSGKSSPTTSSARSKPTSPRAGCRPRRRSGRRCSACDQEPLPSSRRRPVRGASSFARSSRARTDAARRPPDGATGSGAGPLRDARIRASWDAMRLVVLQHESESGSGTFAAVSPTPGVKTLSSRPCRRASAP